MEVAAVAIQQAAGQRDVALSLVKQQARSDQALVNMIAQSIPSGGRGGNLDITI
jgi:hypothetical protein